uniref:Reverse transcriptase domain-containing protein n=1 Tax=Tanacetum cinerariifolium TaxID=118510 RepID=A0A6L2LCY2_TANCI|nr:reverse transcriptase domain-containing protein [Tanacetum cinerariifolium]
MSTRSNPSHLFSSLRDPESLIRRRNLGEPSSLFDFEEVMNNNHNQEPPPQNGPPPMVRPNGQAPQTMEELCQPSINGLGRPIVPIPIQATDFGLRHHMVQQVQNTCQFHGLPSDDANRHINKFFKITQHMKQNGVSDDALHLSLPYSLTHHAIAWRNFYAKDTERMLRIDREYDRSPQPLGHFRTGSLPSNTVPNPREDLKAITTRSGVTLAGPSVSPSSSSSSKEVDREPETITDQLSLLELTSTQMILELANRSTTRPAGIAKDVFVKVGKFHFPTDFVVVDYVVDPRVPLILRRPFLRTIRALIDVYGKELTLCIDDEAITFKVGQTSKYSYNDVKSINRVDIIDVACEEYVQEVLGFSDNSKSGNPTLISDLIIALSSPSLTAFEGGDFILEEIDVCLTSESIPPGIDDTDLDLEGDIRLLKDLLNNDPSLSHLHSKELNVEEIKTIKSSIDEPPELELKE